MAKKGIKGITLEIGGNVQPLNKALEGVNKKTRGLQGELRQVDRLLKLDPKNTELVQQKQQLLGEAVATTSDKLDTLKQAEKEVQQQFERGEVGEEQYRALQREVIKTEQDLDKFEKQLKDVTDTTKDWKQQLDKTGKSLQNAGKKMTGAGKGLTKGLTAPIVAAGAGLVGLATKAGNAADRILDLRDITGLSTDTIQEYQYVANQAGVDTEAMSKAVEGLTRRIPQLESEGGRATEQLAKLGVTYADLDKMSPEQQIDTLINSLADMEDVQERNAIGAQLFGGAWTDIAPILGMGSDEIAKVREEAHEMGTVMGEDALNDANDFRKEMDKLKGMLEGVVNQVGAELAPILTDTLGPIIQDTIIPAISGFAEKIAGLVEWFADLNPFWQKMILGAIGLAAAIGPVLVVLGTIVGAVGKLLPLVKALIGIKKIWTVVQGALNVVLSANPIGAIILAIAALIAIIVLLVKNWDTVVEALKAGWDWIKDVFVAGWEWLSDTWSGIWEGIKDVATSVWGGIIGFFSAGKDRIVGIFTKIKDGILGVWDKIVGGIKGFINLIIDGLNFFIRGMNKIKFSAPDWVPFVGGKEFGINIGEIPHLAKGGDVLREGATIVGENGPELLNLPRGARVSPLDHGGTQTMRHTGTIRVEGINDAGQLVAIKDMLIEDLLAEVRA